MHSNDQIIEFVKKALQNLFEETNNPNIQNPDLDTPLYGVNGNLSSIDLVSLISDIEEVVYNNLGKAITLADEKAMSQKISPFRSVRSLVAYIEKLISESNA